MGGQNFCSISNASTKGAMNLGGPGGMLPGEIFEFIDSLERYFTYFRTRFEEKLQPQKGIFKSPIMLNRKIICVKRCNVDANTTAK